MTKLFFHCVFLACLWLPQQAAAHAADRGFVLLLPTGYYIAGGTLAVAISVLLAALLRRGLADSLARAKWQLPLAPRRNWRVACASLALATLAAAVMAGLLGAHDPLRNPLPLLIWTVFWVLFTLLHAVFGNLFALFNPWLPVVTVLQRWLPGSATTGMVKLPVWLRYWPAVFVFLAFAWFELVSLAPEDPLILAAVVTGYYLVHLAACIAFGYRTWMRYGEPFSIFFRFISLLAPVTREHHPGGIRFGWPGHRLLAEQAVPAAATVFVLLTLATVSFDGLNKTFWWLHLHDINPLAFAGRSSVAGINTRGLLACAALLMLAYFVCVRSGAWLAVRYADAPATSAAPEGRLALAILPISLAYHFAHYLTQLLINGQYTLLALADPFGTGQNLLSGTGFQPFHVSTSMLSNHHSVEILWNVQVAAIVTGHLVSVALAHLIAVQHYASRRQALLSQLPLGILMIGYTCFGLWLLATPTGA